jgi:hypothetical protein
MGLTMLTRVRVAAGYGSSTNLMSTGLGGVAILAFPLFSGGSSVWLVRLIRERGIFSGPDDGRADVTECPLGLEALMMTSGEPGPGGAG